MTVQNTASVTPHGVRDGELGALTALAHRRSGSVYDYARHACGADAAVDATAEAFARFRAAVAAAEDLGSLAPDALLLSCTRHAAAALAPVADGRPECPSTPFLIVARLDGANVPSDEARLTKHLATCARCAERAASFDEAERAFRAPHPPMPEGTVVERVIAALVSAAPTLDDHPGPPADIDGHRPDAVAAPLEPTPSPVEVPPEGVEPGDGEDERSFESDLGPGAFAGPRSADRKADMIPRFVVPAAIVTAAVLLAAGVAGVFGGTAPAPARGMRDVAAPPPPARPPAAGLELQERAARAARTALRRIETRDRSTTRAATLERRRAEEAEARSDVEEPTPSTETPSASGSAPRSSDSTESGTPAVPGATSDNGIAGNEGIETVTPDTSPGSNAPDSTEFTPTEPPG